MKWSQPLKWFGASSTGPAAGTFSRPIVRSRSGPATTGVRTTRASA